MSDLILPTSADWANVNLRDGLCLVDGDHAELVNAELWEGCVGAWSPALDQHPWDYSGKQNTGTRLNGVADAAERWQCDGVDDYISIAKPADLTYAGAMSVAWWSKATSEHVLKGVLYLAGTAGTESMAVAYYASGYNGLLVARKEGSTYSCMPAIAITQTDWHHFCVTNPGGDVASTLYVDDAENSTGGGAGLTGWGNQVLHLGRGVTAAYYAACEIGPTAVFTRRLRLDEIQTLASDRHAMYRMRRLPAVFQVTATPVTNRRRRLLLGAA